MQGRQLAELPSATPIEGGGFTSAVPVVSDGDDLPRAPICHELRAVQPQALDEELAFGGETDDTPIVAFVQVLRQIVLPGMEQTDMRRIVFVPVRALVLVASRTTVDEILFLVGATMCARAIVVDRQRSPDGILVNPAVGAACAKALPDLCAELLGHGIAPSASRGQIVPHEAPVVLRQGRASLPQLLEVGGGIRQEPLLLSHDARQSVGLRFELCLLCREVSRMCGHLLHRWAQRVCFVGVEILEQTRELRAFRVRQRSARLGRTEGLETPALLVVPSHLTRMPRRARCANRPPFRAEAAHSQKPATAPTQASCARVDGWPS